MIYWKILNKFSGGNMRKRLQNTSGIFFIIGIALAGCGGGGSSGSNTPVTGISLNKSSVILMKGSPEQLTASIIPANADNKTVTWSSSDESVAAVSNGLVTAVAQGTAAITAAAGSCSAVCNVRTVDWTHPSGLNDNISIDGENAINPRIAMDDNGNAVIVWQQALGEGYQVYMSEYRGSWLHPGTAADYINPYVVGMSDLHPQPAMDNNGNALIVWRQLNYDYSRYQVFISEYRESPPWDHPDSTADEFSMTPGFAYDPEVAMNGNGDAVAVWRVENISSRIYMKVYQNGTWQTAVQINNNITPALDSAYLQQAVMDDNGNAVVVWQQANGSVNQIYISEYRNGTWSHPQDSNDNISPDGEYAYAPYAAMDNNGNTIIAWRQHDGNYNRIFKSEYRGGEWTHPADLTDVISPDGKSAQDPRVVMDSNGNAVIVWEQYDDDNSSRIFMSEYRNGSWTIPADLNDSISSGGTDARNPEAAMDDNGNAIIVWVQDSTGSNDHRIYKSEYRGGAWTHPSIGNYISSGVQTDSYPQVAMDNTGNAIIAWSQSDGSDYQIFISECR
ncbi:MAG: Ig-like domain-containing protein [Spirochaetes bacterium]|nr:Ig-like domain-containing protein [Spirochaetota bacterium]